MAIDYLMPKLAMAMNEGTVNEWLVEEGELVNKGDTIANIETEKVVYDLESPESGYFHIILPVGETVDCGTLIGKFAENEEEVVVLQSAAAVTPAPTEVAVAEPVAPVTPRQSAVPAVVQAQTGGRVIASPLAHKMAKDRNLPLALVSGTGPGGRIVKRDVLAAEAGGVGRVAAIGGRIEKARVAMTGMRKTTANRLTQSLQTAAQLSSFW